MTQILDVGIPKGVLTTRGDLLTRSATIPARLALGGAGKLVGSDGTDTAWVPCVHSVNDFRLTLTTALSVTTADVTGATTIYLTPHKGSNIGLYDGTQWKVFQTAEISLALGTLTSGLPYDVFVYDNSGTVTLEFLAWTNGTTRATALVRQDGVWSKTGALTRRYVGTFYTTSTTATEDSEAKRFLFNADNRVARPMKVQEASGSWTYTTDTFRSANNSTANRLQYVAGLAENDVEAIVGISVAVNSACVVNVGIGFGVDSTSVHSNTGGGTVIGNGAGLYMSPIVAFYRGQPGVGFHYLQWLEYSGTGGTTTWYADADSVGRKSGITGTVFA